MSFDSTGKISFDDIYTAPDPRAFFGTLRRLDYQIPQLAKPYLTKLIEVYRAGRRAAEPTVLDVGCSYGINAALHRCDTTMDELFEYYAEADTLDHDALLTRDRRLVRSHAGADSVRFVGLDASAPALEYAHATGFLDETIHADLEANDPDKDQQAILDDVDLVVSTGCVGYVTEQTLTRVARGARPWMAHFVLRMFSYEPVAASLAEELGYETASIHGVFRQRRFASEDEQTRILDTLSAAGVDPQGLETEGWLYAQLYVSGPRGVATRLASTLNTL
ncbi:MAG TPA: class I SAM-dependent methyltransferase [Amycolatopsis sp.]|uniref:class I SAM-dependent methyltransferase n=1 Tax=Amycolatopsis sp. TaxID=37632 RepID=UPI002B467F5D|nr:class I SAM-dependent methyltransferase [Amycolatopsis sp.]HKS50102.1 class I SAM-dependent methyltransferase [Amycolatopsis sp.]